MSEQGGSSQAVRGPALARVAEAMLRAAGGGEITVRFAAGQAGNAGELGLAAAPLDEVVLTPVMVRIVAINQATASEPAGAAGGRSSRWRAEILVPATAIKAVVEERGFSSAEALFEAAVGIVHQAKLLRVSSVTAEYFGGAPYLYRVSAME